MFERKMKKYKSVKYILLDIDGVLNTKKDWIYPYTLNPNNVSAFGETFRDLHPKIILTSSWRYGFISKGNINNSAQIKQLECELSKYGLAINGVLNYSGSRGAAVKSFMSSYDNVICIDDDRSEFIGYTDLDGLIFTDCRYGFCKH